jgi:hypothetical protein
MRDHTLNLLLKGGQGGNLLDWIAFEMIQRPAWEATFESRHTMAKLISEKVLRDWPNPKGGEQ